MKTERIISILGLLVLVIAIGSLVYFFNAFRHSTERYLVPTKTIHIEGTPVYVALAQTWQEREQGLSGITGLQQDQGMLFVFEKDGQYSFWMKDMRFSIDMIWISSDKRVVHIENGVSPDSFPQAFTPASQSRYTLEVPAGFVTEHKIEIGSKLEW